MNVLLENEICHTSAVKVWNSFSPQISVFVHATNTGQYTFQRSVMSRKTARTAKQNHKYFPLQLFIFFCLETV